MRLAGGKKAHEFVSKVEMLSFESATGGVNESKHTHTQTRTHQSKPGIQIFVVKAWRGISNPHSQHSAEGVRGTERERERQRAGEKERESERGQG